nr:glycosyltransferase family 1 protein [Saccharopolyspora sp. HNM0983]
MLDQLRRRYRVTALIHDERQLDMLPHGIAWVRVNRPVALSELWISRRLHEIGADVVFSPMQVIGGFRRRYRLIVTLHDLIYYRHPQPPGFLPAPVRWAWRLFHTAFWPQRVLLNRADAVVTVSETTRRLIEHHRLTARPVRVVPNAPPDTAVARPALRDGGGARDLVYMGSFMPYKDVETLIRGMALLPEHRLHLVSSIDPRRERELRALVPEQGGSVVFWRGIGEDDYRQLLAGASALVTASRDEGFGLPVIEAMYAATPVVCTELNIFREVTAGHAAFFAPGDHRGFAAAVRGVADPDVRAALVAAAGERAREFSWQRSADELAALVRELTG